MQEQLKVKKEKKVKQVHIEITAGKTKVQEKYRNIPEF